MTIELIEKYDYSKVSKFQVNSKITIECYDYSELDSWISQLTNARLEEKSDNFYKFRNVRLGFVGEIVFMLHLRKSGIIEYEYDWSNYATHGDSGWDFKVNDKTYDCKTRSYIFNSSQEFFKYLKDTTLNFYSHCLSADKYVLLYDDSRNKKCYIVGWIAKSNLAKYKTKDKTYSPYLSRLSNLSTLFID